MTVLGEVDLVAELLPIGVRAFTTTRSNGSFGLGSQEPVDEVMRRWTALREALRPYASRLATASQVHGTHIITHEPGWEGWLRADAADGHIAPEAGTALAVSVADCVPIFIAHPSRVVSVLHSGWRGTADRILERALLHLGSRGLASVDLHVHLGPAICGRCYEVGPDVHARLTGRDPGRPTPVDLRAIIADHARRAGVRYVTSSELCTKCDNDRLFSHRAGDAGRQLGVIVAESVR